MNYLITAGPTREFLDDIRYISNLSSGRMGYALARAALHAGHRVVLVSGPTCLPRPEGADFVPVVSAMEMRDAVLKYAGKSDIIVMCAAVADYRPAARTPGKMKKGPETLSLTLVKNPDVLAELGRLKQTDALGRRVRLVGFALEADDPLENARRKLETKNADMIVLNLPSAIGADSSDVQVLTRNGAVKKIGPAAKDVIAGQLIKTIDAMPL